MSQREAGVKLTLDDGQYAASMRKVGDAAEHAGQKGHHAMGLFSQGIHGAEHAVHGLHRSLETAAELVTGLAAGFSLEEALKTTIELDSKFKHLAFRISNATGELVRSRDIQEMVEEAAAKTGQRTVALADAFDQLVTTSGDAKFSEEVLEGIGNTATATGSDVRTLARLADELHTKFAVSGRAMSEVLAHVVDASHKGGPQIEELSEVANVMGAEMLEAGLTGKKGLDFMLGALTRTHQAFGSIGKQVKGVKATLLALGDKGKLKDLAKGAGIDPAALLNESQLLGRLKMVLAKGTKGVAAIRGSMHDAEEKKALDVLFLHPFERALQEAGNAGKKGKAQIDQALLELETDLGHFGDSALDAAAIEKEAAERRKDPQAQLQLALENLEKAFGDPEIIAALNDMSQYLPKASAQLASFVKFAIAHPLLAGGGVMAAKAGLGFSEAILGAAAQKGIASAMGGLRYLFKDQQHGIGLDTYAMSPARAAYDKITEAHVVGGMKAGHIFQALFIAAAAAAAAEYIKDKAAEDAQTTGDLAAAGAAASSTSGGIRKQEKEAEQLRVALAKARDSRGGVGGIVEDVFSGLGGAISGEPGAASQKDAQIREMQRLLEEKETRIAEMKEAERRRPDAEPEAPPKVKEADHRASARANADALVAKTLRVHIVGGLGSFAAAGPGSSRGPTSVPKASPGGGY